MHADTDLGLSLSLSFSLSLCLSTLVFAREGEESFSMRFSRMDHSVKPERDLILTKRPADKHLKFTPYRVFERSRASYLARSLSEKGIVCAFFRAPPKFHNHDDSSSRGNVIAVRGVSDVGAAPVIGNSSTGGGVTISVGLTVLVVYSCHC